MGGLHLITSVPSYVARWKTRTVQDGASPSWVFRTRGVLRVSRVFVSIVGILQLIAGIAWILWVFLSEGDLPWYVGLIPAVILFLGALACELALRQMDNDRELGAELERLRSENPLDKRLKTVKERLEFFEGLKEWGILSEEELLENRRALLDLEETRPARPGKTRSGTRSR
jgi:hypothetical protein